MEGLLKKLRTIRIGEEVLKVFIAFDRRHTYQDRVKRRQEKADGYNTWRRSNTSTRGVWTNTRDNGRFVDVFYGDNDDSKRAKFDMDGSNDRTRTQKDEVNKDEKMKANEDGRINEIKEEEIDVGILSYSLIGEVKKLCYLPKIPDFVRNMGCVM